MRAMLIAACILAAGAAGAAETEGPHFVCGKVFVTVPISSGTVASYRKAEIEAVFRTSGGKVVHFLMKPRAGKNMGATVTFARAYWQRVIDCLG